MQGSHNKRADLWKHTNTKKITQKPIQTRQIICMNSEISFGELLGWLDAGMAG